MKLNELSPSKGARKRKRRLGTGSSSGHGGTCGKGSKGQLSRSGSKHYSWFEGGQMPLQRRVPKRGMKPRHRRIFQIVNIASLNRFQDGALIDSKTLVQEGLIKKINIPVKILGKGVLMRKITVKADAFSKKAVKSITSKDGKVEITGA